MSARVAWSNFSMYFLSGLSFLPLPGAGLVPDSAVLLLLVLAEEDDASDVDVDAEAVSRSSGSLAVLNILSSRATASAGGSSIKPSCLSSWKRLSTRLTKYPNMMEAAYTCAACIAARWLSDKLEQQLLLQQQQLLHATATADIKHCMSIA